MGITSKLDSRLYRVKVDGSGLERLLQLSPYIHDWNARAFAVSPDHSRVLTVDDGGVRVTDLSPRATRVLDGTIRPSFLRWSPDGEWIALGFRNSVEIMKPDGTGRKVIASRHEPQSMTMDWSPDGRWLVYERANSTEIAEIGTDIRIPLQFLPSGLGGLGWRR